MDSKKKVFIACLLLGFLGVHRFIEGKKATGFLWLVTLGLFGIGWIYDIFRTFKEAFPPDPEKKLYKEQQRAEAKAQADAKRQAELERTRQMDEEGVPYCPRCKSTSLTANKKGYGIGKGIVGALAIGPWGLLAGGIGKDKIIVTCLKCGHQFRAGKRL